jgi:cytochrome c oxidase assembly protein subunit 15
MTGLSAAALGALALQVLLGAWVAGMNAGQVASSWPLMNERFFPDGVDWSLGIAAFANDPFLVHFLHRWWAWGLVIVLVLFARRVLAAGSRPASIAIHSAFGTQILLGIFTVLSGVAIWLAALHQAVGALLVAATVWGAHGVGRRQ